MLDIPDSDCPVATGGREPVAILRPGETGHLFFVSDQVKRICRFCRFPKRGFGIVARGDGEPGVRIPAGLGI
jgi:hypothetical protein